MIATVSIYLSKDFSVVELKISLCFDDDIVFIVKAFAANKHCHGARTVSRSALIEYPHLIDIVNDLHVPGGPLYILPGTDLPQVHHGYKVLTGNPEN